jgi:hypothetical protein
MRLRTTIGAIRLASRTGPWVLLAAGLASAAVTAVAAASAAPPAEPDLRFEQVFSDRGEPPALHYLARYGAPGAPHRLEVWRDGERRLVRRTDDAIETHVARQPGDPSFQMVVLDQRRKIETRITRDDLYRIGNFTDWFDLAHGLRHPKGSYRLTASQVPAQSPPPLGVCRWYTLAQGGQSTRLCWSASAHLPLLMLGDAGQVLWQVTEIDRKPAPASVFEVRDFGFVRNDANQDISGD